MSVVVFAGPSLPAASIRGRLDALVLPPAGMGDIARAVRRGPRVIALIDGFFERVLPVWHKEILWAMSRGVHVFGAASMGALRAAELHAFGMQGVGRIFDAYRQGELEADDEVAVLHGPADLGFVAVTEALVNIRATLRAAETEGLLDAATAAGMLGLARALHYRERTWDALLARADDAGFAEAAARLRPWLPVGRVDLKREDAQALVTRLGAFLEDDPPPLAVEWPFAWTDAWDMLHARIAGEAASEPVLDELRLQVERLTVVRRAALLRLLAQREAERRGLRVEPATRRDVAERLRARHGLWRRADLARWTAANDMAAPDLDRLVEEEAQLEALDRAAGSALTAAMLAELRASGAYGELAARARTKAARLAEAGLDAVTAAEAGVDLAPRLARLAEQAEALPVASGADLVRRLGFADRASLETAVLREQLFVRMMPGNDGDAMQAPPDTQPIRSSE